MFAAESERLYALYMLAVTTGFAARELFALRWRGVDFEKGVIYVQHTLQEIKGRIYLAEPKTEKSRRLVTLPVLAVRALQ